MVSDELLARLEELKREKETEERQQMEKEEAARQTAGSGGASVRVDGKEPELPVSRDSDSGTSGGGWVEPPAPVETPAVTLPTPSSTTSTTSTSP